MGLATGEVEVWRVAVTPANTRAADGAQEVLGAEERQKAVAFRREVDRALYLVAHVALRVLLGEKLGVPAGDVVLGRADCPGCGGPHGRPVTGGGLEFSLSHSGGLALIAIARDVVGVDAEQRALFTAAAGADIAEQLHPAERAALAALPVADRADGTLSCWVRKEAYLKATGFGLSRGVAADFVGLGPDYPVRADVAALPSPAGWTLAGVPVPDGYAAAVAVRRPAGTGELRLRTWDLDLLSGFTGHVVPPGEGEPFDIGSDSAVSPASRSSSRP